MPTYDESVELEATSAYAEAGSGLDITRKRNLLATASFNVIRVVTILRDTLELEGTSDLDITQTTTITEPKRNLKAIAGFDISAFELHRPILTLTATSSLAVSHVGIQRPLIGSQTVRLSMDIGNQIVRTSFRVDDTIRPSFLVTGGVQ